MDIFPGVALLICAGLGWFTYERLRKWGVSPTTVGKVKTVFFLCPPLLFYAWLLIFYPSYIWLSFAFLPLILGLATWLIWLFALPLWQNFLVPELRCPVSWEIKAALALAFFWSCAVTAPIAIVHIAFRNILIQSYSGNIL